MRMLKTLLVLSVLAVSVPFSALAATVTPDTVKAWFDAAFLPVMWGVGALWSRFPAFKNYTNQTIPWLNLAVYILVKLVGPTDAQAGWFDGVRDFGSVLWVTARGAATSAVASLLYDKFFKLPFDKLAPVPKPTRR